MVRFRFPTSLWAQRNGYGHPVGEAEDGSPPALQEAIRTLTNQVANLFRGTEMPELIGASAQLECIFYILPRAAREEATPASWESKETLETALDGSVTVAYQVADPHWIMWHVLQYGAEAVVLEPEEVRGWVRGAVAGPGDSD